jgi:hypothetical protein
MKIEEAIVGVLLLIAVVAYGGLAAATLMG